MIDCPCCEYPEQALLGQLGSRWWLRCRGCGMNHAAPAGWEPETEECDDE